MMGSMLEHKAQEFKPLTTVSLEELVPEDNFYRQLEEHLDLRFIYELVSSFYSDIGRPSIDPSFFKLQLIAFFEGIRSEPRLMDAVNFNLALRWYLGHDLGEAVLGYSSLSKIRERYGLEGFRRFFEHIIDLCFQSRLVWGAKLYFDSTKVQANAGSDARVDKIEREAHQHLEQLFPIEQNEDLENLSPFIELVGMYQSERISVTRKPSYERIAVERVSPTDPDTSPMCPSSGGSAVLRYQDHYVVDGGKARIILSALVTSASIMDNTLMLELVKYVCSKWKLKPRQTTGDAK
jgi:transposase